MAKRSSSIRPTTGSGRQRPCRRCGRRPTVPTLTVGGWWDQEDFFGPLAIYKPLEPNDASGSQPHRHRSMEPRPMGGGDAGSLGKINFQDRHGAVFSRRRFRRRSLRTTSRTRVRCLWRGHRVRERHPTRGARTNLAAEEGSAQVALLQPDGSFLRSTRANADPAFTSYVSDPARPVPYRPRPIQPTYYPSAPIGTPGSLKTSASSQPPRCRELDVRHAHKTSS